MAPAILPTPIDIRNYQPPVALNRQGVAIGQRPAPIDGLRTLNFEHQIIQDINDAYPQALDRLNAFAYCLSQVVVAPNEQFCGLVSSALKSHFLSLAKLHPGQAQRVLAQPEFQNSPQAEIKDLIKKVTYYNSYSVVKFIHHLHGGLESEKTVSGKAFYAGITLIFGAAATQFISENETAKKIGVSGFTTGGLMVASTVIHAFRKVYQGEP